MMETWLKISCLLCFFGFMKEFRPSEPFVTHYLVGEWKNFTSEQVNQDLFPVGTYAYLAELVVVFLVTDFLRYKPVIILSGMFGIMTWSLLIVGKDILTMQVMEVCYGFFMAAEVAYFTYIYAQVDREHYQKVTSHTRAACLFGRALSGVVSQILVSTGTLDYYELNFVSVAALILATLWAFFLPSVQHSIYFFRKKSQDDITGSENPAALAEESDVPLTGKVEISTTYNIETEQPTEKTLERNSCDAGCKLQDGNIPENQWKNAHYYLWKDFTSAYTNLYVLKWSFWWALATTGFLQLLAYLSCILKILGICVTNQEKKLIVEEQEDLFGYIVLHERLEDSDTPHYSKEISCLQHRCLSLTIKCLNYIQLVWQEIIDENKQDSNTELYNGAVESLYALIGAATSLGLGWLHLNWQVMGEATLAVCSIVEGTLLVMSSVTKSMVVAYILYVLFGVIYHTMITVATAEVAKNIGEDSYGLIFGVNTFIALALQSVLTLVVVSDVGLALKIKTQFQVYGGYFVVLGVVFGCMAVYTLSKKKTRKQKLWVLKEMVTSESKA